MKRDGRGFVIDFKRKVIPLNASGDPSFPDLPGILTEFTPEEVTFMVNRYLYQVDYQRRVHRQRTREEAENLKPIKERVREMYGVSYTQATEEQIRKAAESLGR